MTNPNTPATVDTSNKDEFTQALIAAGFLNPATGGASIHRIKMQGSNLVYNNEVIASYNLKTKEPALIVQLADDPMEYQSMWFEPPLAMAVGRPEVSGRFCKSHFDDPDEARKFSEAYQGKRQSCDTCPVHPFMPADQLPPEAKAQQGASKCSWKADIEFQILERDAEGNLAKNDETVYTMSLPTTSIIEFKGSGSRRGNPLAGSVSPENFKVQLAKLAIEKWGQEGLLKAQTYMRLGGVIAELHLPMATSEDGSRTYYVASFKPIDILEVEAPAAALPGGDTGTTEDDELPF